MTWTQLLTLDGEHRACEPKRLRYQILHVAGQLSRHAGRITLHLPADCPWNAAILRAFKHYRHPADPLSRPHQEQPINRAARATITPAIDTPGPAPTPP